MAESVEAQALKLVQDIKDGKITTETLLGPLTSTRSDVVNPTVNIPKGSKKKPDTAPEAALWPEDEHNTFHVSHVHPPNYENPTPLEKYDLVVIGAGVAGLLSVIMGNGLGKKCALIERHYMGGDCLNVGCFPSKAIIRSARAVHEVRQAKEVGVKIPEGEITVDFPFIMERMRKLRASIAPVDSVARYSRDFCEHVFLGQAKFVDENTVVVGDKTLKFDKAMIATGASAMVPPIPGLVDSEHLTNSNFFNLTELPSSMTVIGAGPIGMELAQTMQRFGCQVTVLEARDKFLPREDGDASELVRASLEADGVDLKMNVKIIKVELAEKHNLLNAPFNKYKVHCEIDGKSVVIESEALLNGTGRAPNVSDLGLDEAKVEYDTRTGVHVSATYQTSNPNVYATGDVSSPFKFTHSADWSARLAIRNMFLGDSYSESQMVIPWCTYTDPEIAHVGLYESELKERDVPHETYMRPLEHVDRCKCDGVTKGFVKMHVSSESDQILGATIVAPHAGDMISEITTCIQYNIGAGKLAGVMHPYPTTQEAVRQCAAQYNKRYRTDAANKALEILQSEHINKKTKAEQ